MMVGPIFFLIARMKIWMICFRIGGGGGAWGRVRETCTRRRDKAAPGVGGKGEGEEREGMVGCRLWASTPHRITAMCL